MTKTHKILSAFAGLALLATCACSSTPAPSGAPGGAASCTGDTAQKVFKLAFNQTDQHPQFKAAVEFGNRLAKATECRYGIKAYANEQLGAQADVVNNVSDGSVELMYIGGPVMESFNPDLVVFNLPYVFASIEAQREVFADEAVMGDLKKSIEGSKNITILGALHAGVRNVYNSKQAVRTPADLAGMKLRVQQSESQHDTTQTAPPSDTTDSNQPTHHQPTTPAE